MAKSNRRVPTQSTRATFGSNAYDLNYVGGAVAVPAPDTYTGRQTRQTARPAAEPRVTPRVHERTRKKYAVREQQAVAPTAVLGFLMVVAVAVALLMGYIQLNSIYAETVELQGQLTTLQSEASNLEARYEEAFDRATLERAVAQDGTLTVPSGDQTVYIDLSEPDNAVVYSEDSTSGLAGFVHAVGGLVGTVVEYFR